MTVLMIACTRRAFRLMQELAQKWKQHRPDIQITCKVKCSSLPELTEAGSLTDCVGEWFAKADAIVFLCAAGIAVRSIAPFLRHKSVDPAVVVLDETGQFCISLLSGHAGGANALAEEIGELTGAVPVITTATDREERFAVDEFARKNGLAVTDWRLAKKISANILEGKKTALYSDVMLEGILPGELVLYTEEALFYENAGQISEEPAILISVYKRKKQAEAAILQLVPKVIAVGIGCRKGTSAKKVARAVTQCLEEVHIMPQAVFAVASIDLKKDEEGILAYCREKNLPFLTYPAELLRAQEGDFSVSAFVEEVTGVSGVCERSAAAAAGGGLFCKKRVYDGVTVALAEKKGSAVF